MIKKYLAFILLFSEISFVFLYSFSFPKKALADNLRIPILFTYGHTDKNEQKLFIDTGAFEVANVIEGYTTKGSNYFKDKGLLFAYHVYAFPSRYGSCGDAQACGQLLANGWKAIFEAGYQAIAVDEFCSTSFLDNNSQTIALNIIRQSYPINSSNHKYIFAWGSNKCQSQVGKGVGVEALLIAINNKADYFMPEIYFYEYNTTFSNFNTYLSKIESAAPGILDKSLIGIVIADTEDFTADLQPNIEFKEYLDEQFHFLKNSQFAARIKGVAAYSYARSRPDTIIWLQQLFKHYYLDNKTTYFSPDDYTLQTIKNSSFEEGTANWQITPTSGSSATVVTYDSLNTSGIRIVSPESMVRVPHPSQRNCLVQSNSRALFIKKGSGQGSNVSQTVTVQPNTSYVVDLYGINGANLDQEAIFDVSLSGTSTLVSSIQKEKTLLPSYTSDDCQTNQRWTKMKVFFTTGPNDTSVAFTITDHQAPANNEVVVDFVQMEKAKGQLPTPTPAPGNLTFIISKPEGMVNLPLTLDLKVKIIKKTQPITGLRIREETVRVDKISSGRYRGKINNLEPGAYDFIVKPPRHLSRKFENVNIVGGENSKGWTSKVFWAGDVSGPAPAGQIGLPNDKIDIYDINLMVFDFDKVADSSGELLFDTDFDGKITIYDLNFTIFNFDKMGEDYLENNPS